MEPTLSRSPAPMLAATSYMDLRAWRCRAVLRLNELACALGMRRPNCVTRANLAAALVVFEWPGPGALRRADCEPLLDYYHGASWSGVLKWVRLLRRVPA